MSWGLAMPYSRESWSLTKWPPVHRRMLVRWKRVPATTVTATYIKGSVRVVNFTVTPVHVLTDCVGNIAFQ